jgi:CheY-like chemotaxis protein
VTVTISLNRHYRRPAETLRLLVADCEDAVAEILSAGLEVCCDALVIRAGSGVIAAQALKTQHIDLAIIDTSLPDISGFELAELVATYGIPVFLISAHPQDQELLARHGYPHLSKPFRLTALMRAVTTTLTNVEGNVASLHRAHAMLRGTEQCRHHYSCSVTGKESPVERCRRTGKQA